MPAPSCPASQLLGEMAALGYRGPALVLEDPAVPVSADAFRPEWRCMYCTSRCRCSRYSAPWQKRWADAPVAPAAGRHPRVLVSTRSPASGRHYRSSVSQGNRGRASTACSRRRDQFWWISAYSAESAPSRSCRPIRSSPSRSSARSIGRPTDRLDRMVESSETMAVRAASSSRVVGLRMRSRIGLPYLDSPICR